LSIDELMRREALRCGWFHEKVLPEEGRTLVSNGYRDKND